MAGPYDKNDFAWRAFLFFDYIIKEAAEKIVMSDPAVAACLFAVDIVPGIGCRWKFQGKPQQALFLWVL